MRMNKKVKCDKNIVLPRLSSAINRAIDREGWGTATCSSSDPTGD